MIIAGTDAVLRREGRTLSMYGLNSGPQGCRALRDFLVSKLKADASIACSADVILITSGSLQALDLVKHTPLARADMEKRARVIREVRITCSKPTTQGFEAGVAVPSDL